jgi:hypothetical protein
MDEVLGDYTSAQTAVALIAAPGANKAIRVHGIFVMSDTAGIVTLLDGTSNSVRFEGYPAANGGYSYKAPKLDKHQDVGIFDVLPNEALDLTTNITGNHAVHVIYEVVKTSF